MTGESVGANAGTSLYEEYSTNSEVYDILMEICRNLNINLYEYNNSLFISAGKNLFINHFGFYHIIFTAVIGRTGLGSIGTRLGPGRTGGTLLGFVHGFA